MVQIDTMTPAVPEIFIAISAILLLLIGVIRGKNTGGGALSLVAVVLLAIDAYLVAVGPSARSVAFGGLFETDGFARFMKTC